MVDWKWVANRTGEKTDGRKGKVLKSIESSG